MSAAPATRRLSLSCPVPPSRTLPGGQAAVTLACWVVLRTECAPRGPVRAHLCRHHCRHPALCARCALPEHGGLRGLCAAQMDWSIAGMTTRQYTLCKGHFCACLCSVGLQPQPTSAARSRPLRVCGRPGAGGERLHAAGALPAALCLRAQRQGATLRLRVPPGSGGLRRPYRCLRRCTARCVIIVCGDMPVCSAQCATLCCSALLPARRQHGAALKRRAPAEAV